MKKYKVLIVHNYYQVPGGEDTVVENEKNLLLDNGHEVVMYTRHNNEIKKKSILWKFILPLETIFSLKTYNDIKKIIRKEKIDIVHVHNTLPLISTSVYYAAKSCKVAVVQTIHNFRLICPSATFTRNNKICEDCLTKGLICSIKNKCYRGSRIQTTISAFNLWLNRKFGTYKKVDGYIALTEFNKEKIGKKIDLDKIYIKPNFMVDKRKCCENVEKNYYIYIGRIDELKGIDLLINAWKSINKSNLIIIGSGPYEDKAKHFCKKNKIQNVEFLGFKKKSDVLRLLKGAKALVLPSQWYEGFPMTIVESFSEGVPVIASDIGNLSVIIENEVNGLLFKHDDVNSLINAINRIDSDYDLMKKLEDGAKKTFLDKYNEKINYKLLINIYNCVLGGENEKL